MLTKLFYDEKNIAVLTLDNPRKLNALSSEFVAEIYGQISSLKETTKVLIIKSSNPKAFAAGVNVQEIHDNTYENAYLNNFIDQRWEAVANLKIPVIAAVSGYALGGGFELALMCDIIVASKNATFGFPEVNLGIMPGMGGTQFLTRTVGMKIASEILMTGRFVKAEEAAELGIINYIEENDVDMERKAHEIAEEIAKKSIMSTRIIKEAIRLSQDVGLSQGIKSERQMFRSLFSTSFKTEGTEAFLNKKK
ncbi:MAG: enoyl-CoA hydratase/isomerase family protein [Alphaproteobacteria bacterium]|nr:enoyl-CoA hydratase/isomerase family protein [Alphaproteobacteria bacterium]